MRSGDTSTDSLATVSAVGLGRGSIEMSQRIQSYDWSTTPLGSSDCWPQSLRTAVQILLSSRCAMWMCWGPELTMLYNDSYRPTLGIKHPWALGKRTSEVWAEIWSDIFPRIDTVLKTGNATYDEGLLLFLERSGFPEETYHTFSYSPLANDSGEVSGMLCVVTEETDRFIGERRIETLRQVTSALSSTITEDEVLKALNDTLSLNKKDLPFTLTYLFDEQGVTRLASSTGISHLSPLAPVKLERGSDHPWPSGQTLRLPAARILQDLRKRGAGSVPDGRLEERTAVRCHRCN